MILARLVLAALALACAAPAFATDATANAALTCDGAWHSLGAGPALVENKQPSTPVQIAVGGGSAPSLPTGHMLGGGFEIRAEMPSAQTIWALCPIPPSGSGGVPIVVTTLASLSTAN